MFLEALPFISEYFKSLALILKQESKEQALSKAQMSWLAICMMGILFTNTISWQGFSRVSIGKYTKAGFSKMCLHGKIAWNRLLICSAKMILKKFKISQGVLLIDDKNHERSKRTEKIHGVHKQKNKKTGGYSSGQNIILLYLVTPYFCLPISFLFYIPDPEISNWAREKILHKRLGKTEKFRSCPERSPNYPKKYELAIQLLEDFIKEFPDFTVHSILADALYGHRPFFCSVKTLFPKSQLISQLRSNQNVLFRNRKMTVSEYFKTHNGWQHKIIVRAGKEINVIAGGARLFVKAHNKKLFIVALKYEGEDTYRYLIAEDLSWNMKDVMQEYTLRWLIEVFFEDWSGYCGFCSLAKQRGYDGSARPLILSLLFDHCFLLHPTQKSFIENGKPLATLGSLINHAQYEALNLFISGIIHHENPQEYWVSIEKKIRALFCVLRPSSKHMNGRTDVFCKKRPENIHKDAA